MTRGLSTVRTALGLMTALTIGMQPARAENTVQQWLTLTGDVRIDRNDNLYGVVVLRSAPDEFKLAQRIVQIGWRHRLADNVTLIGAVAQYTTFRTNGPARMEARLSQGVAMPVATIAAGRLEARLLAEEIFVSGSNDVGIRARPRAKWTRALSGKTDLQLTDEAIIALNSTDAGQVAGLVANRASVGVRFELSKHFGILPYYTWQHVNRTNAADRDDHILGLTFDALF
jgi:Protein of unknown function (DUF2490)